MAVRTRKATVDDVEICKSVIDKQGNHFSPHFQQMSSAGVRRMIEGYFAITKPALLFKEGSSDPVAFVSIHGDEVRQRFYVDLFVHPEGDAGAAVDFVLASCRELEPTWSIHVIQNQLFTPTCAALAARGFDINTTYWTLSAPLSLGMTAPTLPAGIEIHTIRSSEEILQWFEISQDAFSRHDGFAPMTFEQWKAGNLGSPSEDLDGRFLLLVDGEPVGYVECTNYRANLNHGYVDSIGVKHAFHGKGFGYLLLRTAMAYNSRLGRDALDLNADSANGSGALGLYMGVGMTIVESKDEYTLKSPR
jgi:ribosomal protein S18 acetylase RimI-like enzyme